MLMILTGRRRRLGGCSATNVRCSPASKSLCLVSPLPDGYGRVDAGKFVEAAEGWSLVKPQAWFDSPAVYLPDTYTVTERKLSRQEDEEDDEDDSGFPQDDTSSPTDETNPPPIVQPSGTLITEDGITSTYEITSEMLDDSNFERLEHVTIRVWIDHKRRGDVEVEVTSPNGITSVLARQRRFDDADTGYPGWKFMSLKHWYIVFSV